CKLRSCPTRRSSDLCQGKHQRQEEDKGKCPSRPPILLKPSARSVAVFVLSVTTSHPAPGVAHTCRLRKSSNASFGGSVQERQQRSEEHTSELQSREN